MQLSEFPLVSIIVLNYNGEKYIHKCVESIRNQSYENIETIVVDNGSTDGSLYKLESSCPEFNFIHNKENFGYAQGMNIGIGEAKGEYVIPLNLDVYLERDFVKKCVLKIESNSALGGIGGKEYAWENGILTNKPSESCGPGFLRRRIQGVYGDEVDEEQYCFGVMGSFPFFRKSMLNDLYNTSGYYFDPDFGTGWEDRDLFFRLHLRGWQFLYYPAAFGWHVGSSSAGEKKKLIEKPLDFQMRIFRNRYFLIKKNLPLEIKRWLFFSLVATEISMIFYYLSISPRSLVALFRANWEVLGARKKLRIKRQHVQDNIKIDPNSLKKFFIKF